MHRACLALLLSTLALPVLAGEIRTSGDCALAVEADPEAAREEAAVWRRLGGGTAAELCEAAALEAMGAYGSAALALSRLAENPRRAIGPELRLVAYEDAARLWLRDGRPDLALATLDNIDRLAPPTRSRLVMRAEAAAAEGDWPAAAAALDAQIAADPGDAPALALRAAALRRGGDPAAAEASAAAALALDPDLAEGLFEAGAARAETGDREAAAGFWRRLIEVHPDHPMAVLARRNLAAPE